ncbi:MAG TPA: sugar phosphate isomerase/epimerase family protein [Nocardioidaceae bacterium]|nr:sugar phosphate isomerase/epimerase family protein [Nocardioidaceae bacterium]
MGLKLAAQEQMLDGDDLVEKYDFAQRAGFDGIELRGAGDGRFADRLDEVRAARAAGVVIPSVCVMMDHFIGDFDLQRRRDAQENMKILLSVIVEAGGFGAITPASFGMFSRRLPPFDPPRSPDDDRAVLVEGLHVLGEHAAQVGAVVLLEPLNRYEDHMVNTLADASSLVHEVGSDAVRVIGDTFHMSIEEADIPTSIRDAAPVLAHIQLGDTNRLEPGAGHLDWKELLGALDEIDYSGWLAMECGLSGPPAEVLPRVSALLRGSRTGSAP